MEMYRVCGVWDMQDSNRPDGIELYPWKCTGCVVCGTCRTATDQMGLNFTHGNVQGVWDMQDGNRPDGIELYPWKCTGCVVCGVWDMQDGNRPDGIELYPSMEMYRVCGVWDRQDFNRPDGLNFTHGNVRGVWCVGHAGLPQTRWD